MKPPLALALLLVLAPALAGCTWFQPPPPTDPVSDRIVQQAFVVPDLQVRVDSPFANLRLTGRALAVPVHFNGTEGAAVYLRPMLSWRADAIFQAKEAQPMPAEMYVQPPAGEWAQHRAAAAWQAATAADLAAAGFPDERALFARASHLLPIDPAPPKPSLWSFNGTLAARFEPRNVSLASEVGPIVFQRDDEGFLTVENRTIITWREADGNLSGTQDVLFGARIHDPELASLEMTWNATRADVRVRTAPFRVQDLKVQEDRVARVVSVDFPEVATVSMLKYVTSSIQDSRVELRSQNVTLVMAP